MGGCRSMAGTLSRGEVRLCRSVLPRLAKAVQEEFGSERHSSGVRHFRRREGIERLTRLVSLRRAVRR